MTDAMPLAQWLGEWVIVLGALALLYGSLWGLYKLSLRFWDRHRKH